MKITGSNILQATSLFFFLPGVHFGDRFMTRMTSSSIELHTPSIISMSETEPSVFTLKLTVTLPWTPASFALFGYTSWPFTHFEKLLMSPPSKEGLDSISLKGTGFSSEVF